MCFTFEKSLNEEMKRQAEFTVVDHKNVNVKVKNTVRMPRDFKKTLEYLAFSLGYTDISKTQNYKLDTIPLLQIELYNAPDHLNFHKIVTERVNFVLDEIWETNDPRRPKVYVANRKISKDIARSLFKKTEDDSWNLDVEALSAH